ncbi:MAG: hypothetical protein JWQ44_376 [Chthoniobacter sp.]|nr:hypothetical protein [Chthoniobacter sp.]
MKAILISLGIALIEYCFAVPASRIAFREFSDFQLKIMQEPITLLVFVVFAVTFLQEKLVAFLFIARAAFFAFAFKPETPA